MRPQIYSVFSALAYSVLLISAVKTDCADVTVAFAITISNIQNRLSVSFIIIKIGCQSSK